MTDDTSRDITPDKTHVRMSVAKFWAMVSGIVAFVAVGVASALSYWFGEVGGLKSRQAAHEADTDRHLDKDYQKDHGRPVGKWDLDVVQTHTANELNDVRAELKRMNDLQQESLRHVRR